MFQSFQMRVINGELRKVRCVKRSNGNKNKLRRVFNPYRVFNPWKQFNPGNKNNPFNKHNLRNIRASPSTSRKNVDKRIAFESMCPPRPEEVEIHVRNIQLGCKPGGILWAHVTFEILLMVTESWVQIMFESEDEHWKNLFLLDRECVEGASLNGNRMSEPRYWNKGDLVVYPEMWLSHNKELDITDVVLKLYVHRKGLTARVETFCWKIWEVVKEVHYLLIKPDLVLTAWSVNGRVFVEKRWLRSGPFDKLKSSTSIRQLNAKRIESMHLIKDCPDVIAFHFPPLVMFYNIAEDKFFNTVNTQQYFRERGYDRLLFVRRLRGNLELIFESDTHITTVKGYLHSFPWLQMWVLYTFPEDKKGRCSGFSILGVNLMAAVYDNYILQWRYVGSDRYEPPCVATPLTDKTVKWGFVGADGIIITKRDQMMTIVPDQSPVGMWSARPFTIL